MKHRVMIQLDADQLHILKIALDIITGDNIGEPDTFAKLRDMIVIAKEVCENYDRADEAERTLSQLVTRAAAQ